MSKKGTPRNRNHQGGVYFHADRKNKPHEARIWVDGKQHSYYFATPTEAERKLRDIGYAIDHGKVVPNERLTVGQFLTKWIEEKRSTVRPKTWVRYEEIVRLHLIRALGKIRLIQLWRHHIEKMCQEKVAAGMSPRTARHLRAVLRAALEDAIRDKHITQNAAKLARPVKMEEEDRPILTEEGARHLIQVAIKIGERLVALYLLALCAPARQSELLALRWSDVDWEAGRIEIKEALHYLHGQFSFGPPKTRRAKRPIELPPVAIEALKVHKARQAEERLKMGPLWDSSYDLVFCNSIGRPIEATNLLRRSFYPLLEKAGLPKMHFHDLRHTGASFLFADGNYANLVADIIGHSDPGFTMKRYGHKVPGTQASAVATMQRIFGDNVGQNVGQEA